LDAVKVTPALVFWEKGEANKTKEIAIAASPGQTINAVKVTSSDPRIRANVETVREGQNYVIRVSPESTETAGFAVLNIEAALAGETMKLRAHAQIKSTAQ
ncbi:MAG: hypothetical protein V4710_20290, partial [Verrucomicrobiota bacterium]